MPKPYKPLYPGPKLLGTWDPTTETWGNLRAPDLFTSGHWVPYGPA